ncbi:ABC transporter permease [Aneurinibacillus thermoaerophilus]|uniref:ABC transporter permease n=1 Tax=Aneurinibacillus thermoaerophilus TaxID=143495 RepID=UPI002E2100F3|nr:ABC transporter permease [Aneurinibacillus thermoaerophilus]
MSRLAVFMTEMYKQKNGVMWWLVIGGPLLIAALVWIDVGVRYDYLITKKSNAGLGSWGIILGELMFLWAFFCPIGVTLIAAIVHYREFSENAWKHLLSLPVTRRNVYFSKWFLILLLTYLAIFVLFIGLFVVGKMLEFSEPFAWELYGRYALYQALGVLGIVSIQHWLSSRFKNVIVPIAIGITLSVCALFFAQSEMLSFFPHVTILYATPLEDIANNRPVWSGLIAGPLLLVLGMHEFKNRDIV